eukprot:gene29801-7437_t
MAAPVTPGTHLRQLLDSETATLAAPMTPGTHELRQLFLQHCMGISDEGLYLLGSLRRLEMLDLSYCTFITGAGFMGFRSHNRLQTLAFTGSKN